MSPRAKHSPRPARDGPARDFALRKLHSLSGVLPVGVFVVLHLVSQSSAMRGRAAYDAAIARADGLPLQPLLEVVLVVVPLVFHASYGLVLTARSRPTVGAHPTHRNWMYTAQRVTGLIAFVWILWHAGETWVPRWLGHIGPAQVYPSLVHSLSSTTAGLPLAAMAYLVGIGASSFHLANGLWGAGVSWGLLVSRRAQMVASVSAVVLGLGLFLVGTNVTVFLATGARVFGSEGDREPEQLGADACREPAGQPAAGSIGERPAKEPATP